MTTKARRDHATIRRQITITPAFYGTVCDECERDAPFRHCAVCGVDVCRTCDKAHQGQH